MTKEATITRKGSRLYEEVQVFNEPTLKTGKTRFDNWFSADKGIVWGSAIYISGTSGAGKTTLMVNLMKWLAPKRVSMYLREMEGRNVKSQTKNLKMPKGSAYISDVSDCPTFDDYMKELDEIKPSVVIVDSLQVIALEDYELTGKMSEDKAGYFIIKTLREWCSKNNAILFLIGHNTKDGNFAGKNTLIQMMDAHIVMEHDKKNDCRKISWGQKNRKGPMGMLYYDFGKEEIVFFLEEEWEVKESSERRLVTSIMSTASAYLETVDKTKANYKKFKKEYDSMLKEIDVIQNDIEYVTEYIKRFAEISEKHSI